MKKFIVGCGIVAAMGLVLLPHLIKNNDDHLWADNRDIHTVRHDFQFDNGSKWSGGLTGTNTNEITSPIYIGDAAGSTTAFLYFRDLSASGVTQLRISFDVSGSYRRGIDDPFTGGEWTGTETALVAALGENLQALTTANEDGWIQFSVNNALAEYIRFHITSAVNNYGEPNAKGFLLAQ